MSMDDQRSLLLNWTHFYHQEKSMDDELRQSFLLTMALEQELKMRDEQIAQLKHLLSSTIRERDEAQEKCQKVILEKLLLQQQLQNCQQSAPRSGISSINNEEDDPRRGSDSDESIVSSPPPPPPAAAAPAPQPHEEEPEFPLAVIRPLPEKGKLLQAVMKAGPLLHTLLVAGPLPQWRHPPPPLDAYQIPPPPVVVPPSPPLLKLPTFPIHHDSLLQNNLKINDCGEMNRKRGLSDGSDSFNEFKYQRVLLQ